ncbi:hypothetical protein ATCC90586_005216 [Pythium insidiosum]|nr:hypothetical protein ATCC90586_005216 [Pythium insidiosum]
MNMGKRGAGGAGASSSSTTAAMKPGTVYESRAGVAPALQDAKHREPRGIWEEYYPLIQPAHQYHHHRNGRGSSNYFFHGMFSSDVLCAYRDAVIAYLVTTSSMTVLSLTGLVFCKQWGIESRDPIVFLFRCIWLVSPSAASIALRHIPVLCELAAFSFTAATRMVNPFNRVFVQKLEMVFSFNDVDALDSGLVFYVFYTSILGIFWDPLPPPRYDFGLSMNLRPVGCSWFLLAMIQEIGWSGSLFPALEIVFSHSTLLASAATGMVWALWYWPMIIADAIDVVPAGSGYAVVETRDFHLLYLRPPISMTTRVAHVALVALCALLCALHVAARSPVAPALELVTPSVILHKVPFAATIQLAELKNGSVYPRFLDFSIVDAGGAVLRNGSVETVDSEGNFRSRVAISVARLKISEFGTHSLTTTVSERLATDNTTASTSFQHKTTTEVFVTPGWLSVLPPLVTLVISAALSQVLLALLAGVWCGATIVAQGNPLTGFLRTFDTYWVDAFVNDGHAGVLLFTIILGGAIGVVQKGGGGHGLALLAKQYMTTSLRMQLSTWLLCLLIFFDDYSCILIIGSSLRQVLSQTGVSREKFAAIIHTIGVCLPSMAPVSSWIGVEIGYVAAQIRDLKLDWDPFLTCLSCLHYRFFPILFIGLIFITIITEKDFGPMVQFEKDAATSPLNTEGGGPYTPLDLGPCASPEPELGPLEPDTQKPLRWQNAVIPFVSIILLTFFGMIYDGYTRLEATDPDGSYGLMDALSNCNSVAALIRASAAGWVIAVAMLLLQRIVTIDEATKAWIEGVKDILDPTLVLVLAWALGTVIGDVNVAPYVASVVGDEIQKEYLPAIASVLCFIVSFATGSAFGTMAIMFPIISPLSYTISGGDQANLLQCFGSILGASTFGNTCSPIADTSILASLSAHIPLQNHIRSIMPYALLVATLSVVGGALPVGMNLITSFTAFGVCLGIMLLVVYFCGTRVNSRYRRLSSCSFFSESPPSKYTRESEALLKRE